MTRKFPETGGRDDDERGATGDEPGLPHRLVEGDGPAAALLRKLGRQEPPAAAESAAWDRTLSRLVRDAARQRLQLRLAVAFGAVAAAAILYLLVAPRQAAIDLARRTSPVNRALPASSVAVERRAPTPASTPVAPPTGPGRPRIQLGREKVGLPQGPVELLGEAEVVLAHGGTARAFVTEPAAIVELSSGAVDLHVAKRPETAGHRFDVVAGPYRFTVLGTRFRVVRTHRTVTLSVSEGRVAVHRGPRLLSVVVAGGDWAGAAEGWNGLRSSDLGGGAAAAPPVVPEVGAPAAPEGGSPASARVVGLALKPAPAAAAAPGFGLASPAAAGAASPATHPSLAPSGAAPPAALAANAAYAPLVGATASGGCGARAARDGRDGLRCYLAEARGGDLPAEVALYEAARLRRDALSDPAGALETLREHRRRFPAGTLSTEVALSIAELLPKLGRYREALDEATSLLAANPHGERLGELQLLRGHVLREGFHDCAGAERAYAAATEAVGVGARAADPAEFWRAVCLETLGRAPEARVAYQRYLARPGASLTAQARRRLAALDLSDGPARSEPGGSP